jgi:hypothetical protein
VNEHLLQVFELECFEVTCATSSVRFFALETNAYMCLLQHGYIVTTVTNAQRSVLGLLEHARQLRFLQRADSRGNYVVVQDQRASKQFIL